MFKGVGWLAVPMANALRKQMAKRSEHDYDES